MTYDVLNDPVKPTTIVGQISTALVNKYNFSPLCNVVAFSGDNPSALVGIGANKPNSIVISLGTSDTIFVNLGGNIPEDSKDAHIFCSALDNNGYIALCCYKNGSLAREKVLQYHKLESNQTTWDKVGKILTGSKAHKAIQNRMFSIYYE